MVRASNGLLIRRGRHIESGEEKLIRKYPTKNATYFPGLDTEGRMDKVDGSNLK